MGAEWREGVRKREVRDSYAPSDCRASTLLPFGRCHLCNEAGLSLLVWSGSSSSGTGNKAHGSPGRFGQHAVPGPKSGSQRLTQAEPRLRDVQGQKCKTEPGCKSALPHCSSASSQKAGPTLFCTSSPFFATGVQVHPTSQASQPGPWADKASRSRTPGNAVAGRLGGSKLRMLRLNWLRG